MDRNPSNSYAEITEDVKRSASQVLNFLFDLSENRTDIALQVCCIVVASVLCEGLEHAEQNMKAFNENLKDIMEHQHGSGTVH